MLGRTEIAGAGWAYQPAPACGQFIDDGHDVSSFYWEAGGEPGIALSLSHIEVVSPYRDEVAPSVAHVPSIKARFDPDNGRESRGIDDREVLADALIVLGEHALRHGMHVIAAFHIADALALNCELGGRAGIAQCLERVAHLATLNRGLTSDSPFHDRAATAPHASDASLDFSEQQELPALASTIWTRRSEDASALVRAGGERAPAEDAKSEALAFLFKFAKGANELKAREIGAPPTAVAGASPADLTPREQEVLSLLCQQLSDAEIGARLYIGVRTVEFHVANILRKLGVENRRDAAALVARRGS